MHSKDSNARFNRFVAPAWQSPQIGRVIIVLIGIEVIFRLVSALTDPLYFSATGDGPFPIHGTIGTIIAFGSFGIILVLFHFLSVIVHRRGVETMFGPLDETWEDFKRSLWVVGLAAVAIHIAPPFIDRSDLAFSRDLPVWLIWLVPGIIAITIQATTEEVIYRGYLQQQVAVYMPNKIAWMGIPSVLFGISHYWNGYGPSEGVFFVIWATFLGLACADLTNRSGNIGAAIGLHTANNLYATLFVAVEGWSGSGLALYLFPYVDPWEFDYALSTLLTLPAIFEMVTALTVMLIMWLAARIAIRR